LDQIDAAVDDWSVGPDAMRVNAPPGSGLAGVTVFTVNPVTVNPVMLHPISARCFDAMSNFARQMAKFAEAVDRMVQSNNGLRRALGLPLRDRDHPRPLCIDGAAYHRKRNARRGRR